MSRERFRRRYLVNPRYQLTQAGVAIAANIVVALLMAVLMSWFYLLYLNRGVACNHNHLFPFYVIGATLVVLLVSMALSFRRSRAVAGMMCKLDIVLRDAAKGILPDSPLMFRKGDYFGLLARPLNDCFAQLRLQKNSQAAALDALRALKSRIGAEAMGDEQIAFHLDAIITGLTMMKNMNNSEKR